jgi:hypothetical protein
MHPTVDGIEPLREFSCKSRSFAFVRNPRVDGRVLIKEFTFIERVISAVNRPIEGDMLPINPFEPNTKEVTSKLNAQVTPVQVLQILVAGMPPLQDQPVNPVPLNAAAISHIAASFADGVGEEVGDAVGGTDGFGDGRLDGLPDGWPVG